MTCFNLIPAVRRNAKKRRARLHAWIALSAGYAVMVLTAIVASHAISAFDDAALGRQLADAERQLEESQNQARTLRDQYRREHDNWETQKAVSEQPDWSLLLALLAQAAGEEIVFRACDLQPVDAEAEPMSSLGAPPSASQDPTTAESYRAHIAGLGRSQSAVSLFVVRLDQLRLFQQVRLVETRREPFLDAEAVAFRIECTIDGSQEEKQ